MTDNYSLFGRQGNPEQAAFPQQIARRQCAPSQGFMDWHTPEGSKVVSHDQILATPNWLTVQVYLLELVGFSHPSLTTYLMASHWGSKVVLLPSPAVSSHPPKGD